jgi:protein SCO1
VRTLLTVLVVASATLPACSRAREYELRGQILVVDRSRHEITIKHDDIRGFMPGMTMPFKVRDNRLMDGRDAGDLVKATLVVRNDSVYLSAIEKTGHAAVTDPPPPPRVDLLEPGQRVPDVRLVDESGSARSLSDWKGRVLAVTFVYTRCPMPDFCPRMDQHFREVQRRLLADPVLRDRAALLTVSFDPAFDTPPILAAHARQAGADPAVWHFVTGERNAIAAFAGGFGVAIMGEEPSAEITHSLRTAVIGSDGSLVSVFRGNEWTPADLLDALRRAH